MSGFSWLQNWYQNNCDGDWEHTYGIDLKTIRNWGWFLTVGLEDTELEEKKFEQIIKSSSRSDWIFCTVMSGKFQARCGITNLLEVVTILRRWAGDFKVSDPVVYECEFSWIQNWYQKHCNGKWEFQKGIHIGTLDNPGWYFEVDLTNTDLEGKKFERIKINRSDEDWILAQIEEGQFQGYSGAGNLLEILNIFRDWAEQKSKI